jgi:hypothetical protein
MNAHVTFNTACELGFRGNLDEWERLMVRFRAGDDRELCAVDTTNPFLKTPFSDTLSREKNTVNIASYGRAPGERGNGCSEQSLPRTRGIFEYGSRRAPCCLVRGKMNDRARSF